jgi:O-antigen/teichoic acid export membrane protein
MSALLSRLKYIRLRPFPTDTEQGRAAERYRLAGLGAIATVSSRAAAMVLMVLTVRWAAPALGTERFGVWATFSSMVAMLSFLDLGVGNALINQVANAAAAGDAKRLVTVVMGGLGWLIVIGIAAALVLAAAGALIPWGSLFKLSTHAVAAEARAAAFAFSILFGLNIVSNGLLKVLAGQQRSYMAQLIVVVGTLCSAPAVWYVAHEGASVGMLLIAGFGLQACITSLVALRLLWSRGILDIRVAVRSMREQRGPVFASGSLFFTMQIGTMIGWGSDALLVASFSGASAVAAFAIAQRLFLFASQPVSIANTSLWPAYADAYARTDRGFLRHTLRRSLFLSIAVAFTIAAFLLIAGPWIIPHWTKNAVAVPETLLAVFALWTCFEAGGTSLAMYLNGVGVVREQVVATVFFCAIALPVKIWSIRHAGPTGLVLATTVSYLLTIVALYSTVFRRAILDPIRMS